MSIFKSPIDYHKIWSLHINFVEILKLSPLLFINLVVEEPKSIISSHSYKCRLFLSIFQIKNRRRCSIRWQTSFRMCSLFWRNKVWFWGFELNIICFVISSDLVGFQIFKLEFFRLEKWKKSSRKNLSDWKYVRWTAESSVLTLWDILLDVEVQIDQNLKGSSDPSHFNL